MKNITFGVNDCNEGTDEFIYRDCIKEIDSLGDIVFKGVLEETIAKYKKLGLRGVWLKEVRAYAKEVLK